MPKNRLIMMRRLWREMGPTEAIWATMREADIAMFCSGHTQARSDEEARARTEEEKILLSAKDKDIRGNISLCDSTYLTWKRAE